jgi:DNA-binding MarR family transcriptional regulator
LTSKDNKASRDADSPRRTSGRAKNNADLSPFNLPGHLIRRLQQVAVSLFIDEVSSAGLELTPVQYAALVGIRAYPGIDQAALAGLIAYDRATIGSVVDRLEAKDMVRRQLSKEDRRVRVLTLEPAGEAILRNIPNAVQRAQERILAPLDRGEQATLMALLSKLVSANNEWSRAPARPVKIRQKIKF